MSLRVPSIRADIKRNNIDNSLNMQSIVFKPTLRNDDEKKQPDFSTTNAAKNLVKGIVSPITNMFKSGKNFAIGIGSMVAFTGLTLASGGAFAVVAVGAGVIAGAVDILKFGKKMQNAETNKDKENAFYTLGQGLSTFGLSALGAKSALKYSKIIDIDKISTTKAVGISVANLPKYAIKTVKNIVNSDSKVNRFAFSRMLNPKVKPKFIMPAKGDNVAIYNECRQLMPEHMAQIYKNSKNINSFTHEQSYMLELFRLKRKSLIDISTKLAKEALNDHPSYVQSMKRIIGSDFSKVTYRPKTVTSIYSKLEKGFKSELEKKLVVMPLNKATINSTLSHIDMARPLVGDLHATRITLKGRRDFDKIESLVDRLKLHIEDGSLKVTEIENYHGSNNAPYFTSDQVKTLYDAQTAYWFLRGSQKSVKIPNNTEKSSGYVTTQLNTTTNNHTLGELQVRGTEVNNVESIQHIVYDIVQGKDPGHGIKEVQEYYKPVIEFLSNPNDKSSLMNYLKDYFNYARKVEAGEQCLPPKVEGKLEKFSYDKLKQLKYVTSEMKLIDKNSFDIRRSAMATSLQGANTAERVQA